MRSALRCRVSFAFVLSLPVSVFSALAAACSRTGLAEDATEVDAAGEAGDAAADIAIDAPDAPPAFACPDAGSWPIYVVTEQASLYAFDPPSAAFTRVGTLMCPVPPRVAPYSMAVARTGDAYVL